MNAPPDPDAASDRGAPPEPDALSDPHQPHRRTARSLDGTLRAWGIAVLVVGLAAAALIAAFAPGATPDDLANRVAQGRMYRHNLELMGGTTGVLIDEFDRWFAALWHGRALAATIAVLAIAVALVCFVAARLARKAQSDPRQPVAKTDRP